MTALSFLAHRLRHYRRSERGSFSIEAVLVLPLMAWVILAAFSHFDGLRQNNINIKAAHTLSDMLSRETVPIDAAYVEGMQGVLDFLTGNRFRTALRISVFRYDDADEAFVLQWSEATGTLPGLTEDTQNEIDGSLPATADGDTIIAVETWIDYRAPFTTGLEDTVLYQLASTRARYVPQLVFRFEDGTTSADPTG